ncbi:hypothetical protein H6G04_21575 [Calothrix membranacea FACHB-236]|nr:hypothetical protein [Calothrix membranacea FACHB-236]
MLVTVSAWSSVAVSLLIERYELLYLWRFVAYAMVRRRRDLSEEDKSEEDAINRVSTRWAIASISTPNIGDETIYSSN